MGRRTCLQIDYPIEIQPLRSSIHNNATHSERMLAVKFRFLGGRLSNRTSRRAGERRKVLHG